MLKRSIYRDDPLEPSIEQKIFRATKITCIIFAGAALTLSVLDLMKTKSVKSTSEPFHTHSIADILRALHAELTTVALAEPSPYVTVAIPRGNIALRRAGPKTHNAKMRAALERDLSPVAALSDAAFQNAVKVAMDAPPMGKSAETARLSFAKVPPNADPPLSAVPASHPAQLASLNAGAAPQPELPPLPPPISLPAEISVLPRPAPPMSPAQRLHLIGKARRHAEACLARAIYFEARNQPFRGQVAVAQVVINRVFSGIYPRDVCGVIYQNAHHYLGCQFTFACDGKPDIVTEWRPWVRARRIAKLTLDGKLYVRAVGTATHYHATYVHPYWVREMRRYAREGIHLFYRPRAWGNGSDEPIWSSAELAANQRARRRR